MSKKLAPYILDDILEDINLINNLNKNNLQNVLRELVVKYNEINKRTNLEIENIIESTNLNLKKQLDDFEKEKKLLEKNSDLNYFQFKKRIITTFLEIVDSLEIFQQTQENKVIDGIISRFYNILNSLNVEVINTKVGDEYDPSVHYVLYTESKINEKKGKIVKIIKKGFTFNEEILRHTMVSISE